MTIEVTHEQRSNPTPTGESGLPSHPNRSDCNPLSDYEQIIVVKPSSLLTHLARSSVEVIIVTSFLSLLFATGGIYLFHESARTVGWSIGAVIGIVVGPFVGRLTEYCTYSKDPENEYPSGRIHASGSREFVTFWVHFPIRRVRYSGALRVVEVRDTSRLELSWDGIQIGVGAILGGILGMSLLAMSYGPFASSLSLSETLGAAAMFYGPFVGMICGFLVKRVIKMRAKIT